MWKVFNFVGREQAKNVETKPNSGYYLMQQEREMCFNRHTKITWPDKKSRLHDFGEDQNHDIL